VGALPTPDIQVHHARPGRLQAGSTEYISVEVTGEPALSRYGVFFIFTPTRTDAPASPPVAPGAWEREPTSRGGMIARVIVGPHGTARLDPGRYSLRLEIMMAPQHLVRAAGYLDVE
jgi:hypothetical protein